MSLELVPITLREAAASQHTSTLGRLAAQGGLSALLPTAIAGDAQRGRGMGNGTWDCLRSALLPTASTADATRGVDGRDRRLDGLVTALAPTPTVHGNHNRRGASERSGDGLATAFKAGRATLVDPLWLVWFMGGSAELLGVLPDTYPTTCDPRHEGDTTDPASPGHDCGSTARTWR